jgi:hypothetical protein
MGRPLRGIAWLSVAAALALSACKPHAGGKCQVGQAVCIDPQNVLACQGGVFIDAKCRGPGGCNKLGTKVSCDDQVAEENEACLESENDNRACSVDMKRTLQCTNGKFQLVQYCRGPKGCAPRGDSPICDNSVAEKDDVCTMNGQYACSADGKSRLACTNGKWAFDRICRGNKGCQPQKQFECDVSLSEVGDPCDIPGLRVCSDDQRSELQCGGGQFVKVRDCRRGCKPGDRSPTCQ